ncbi:MAG TPA: hypothetical protein VGK36_18700 [Candidatus Angelobacter sp.]|jgi:hypothetical protein
MLSDPILHRVLTNPWFYRWVAAVVSPLLIWAVLVRLSQSEPDILSRIYPGLKLAAWTLWASFVVWSLFGLSGVPERKTFYGINLVFFGLMGGTNLMHSWVRRRVDPDSVKTDEGWWPAPKGLPEVKPSKNL